MVSEARKLHIIEEVLKIKSVVVLSEIEAIIKKSAKPKNTRKLSDKYAGSLKLTDKQYNNFQNQVCEGRSEWERDI